MIITLELISSLPPKMIKLDVIAIKMGPKDATGITGGVTVGLRVYLKVKPEKVRSTTVLR